jgi:hypothetical protein
MDCFSTFASLCDKSHKRKNMTLTISKIAMVCMACMMCMYWKPVIAES